MKNKANSDFTDNINNSLYLSALGQVASQYVLSIKKTKFTLKLTLNAIMTRSRYSFYLGRLIRKKLRWQLWVFYPKEDNIVF